MPSQCSIVLWTATIIYVKILSFPSSHRRLCCSPFSVCGVDSSHPASLVSVSAHVLYCQTVSIFCPVSPSVSPPRFSASVCFCARLPPTTLPSLSSCIDLHFFLLHFAVLSVSLLSPFHTTHSLDSFILCLVSCPPALGWTDTTSCKKREKTPTPVN